MLLYRLGAPFWALLGISAVLLCSCETPPEGPSADGVSALQFSDIPVPAGLTLRDQQHNSDSAQVGEYRYANFEYSGAIPVAEVSSYLRERMPQHSWELTGEETDAAGNERLSFQRGKYFAECRMARDKKSVTRLHVTVRTSLARDK